MELNFNNLLNEMLGAAEGAFGDGWSNVKNYAPGEFKKISSQLLEIADNVAKYKLDNSQGFSPETGKLLLKMQVNATHSVLVAVSTLTLLAVQNAINGIFEVLKNTFSELVPVL